MSHVEQSSAEIRAIKDQVIGLYDRAAETYDHVGPRFFTYFGQRLVELTHVSPEMQVLDVATGRGAIMFASAETMSSGIVTGFDLSPKMVEHTATEIRERGIHNAQIVQMDAEQLGFSHDTFDRVLCGSALFFFPNLRQALSEFYRVLKPGGQFGATIWGHFDERWFWLDDLKKTAFPEGFAIPRSWQLTLPPDALVAELAAAGFPEQGITVSREQTEFEFTNAQEWWEWQHSNGNRFVWDAMPSEKRERCKALAFQEIERRQQTEGLPHMFEAVFVLATKSVNTW